MILATHIAIAAAAAKPFAGSNSAVAFLIGIVSHYVSDAVPHWHYPTRTLPKEKEEKMGWTWRGDTKARLGDFARFALDGIAGITIVLLVSPPATVADWQWIGMAALGSVLPDALQGVYFAGARVLAPHQVFHDRLHAGIRLDAYPWIGVPFQLAIGLLALYFLR